VFLKRKAVIALCVCIAITQACRHERDSAPDITLTHEISPQPPRVGPSTITFRIADASGKPVTGVHVQFEMDMSHPGMTGILAFASETEPGQYSSTIELSMAGDWYVMVFMKLPDGRSVKRQFEIKGVSQR
jgi:hypothetical protein